MPPQPLPPNPTVDYGTAYNELGSTYDPQVQQTQTQIDALPGQQATALSSLDQAKANAFKDNALTSNAKGVLFSGYTPQANQDYTANTYNPSVDKLNTTVAANKQSLLDKINDINNQRAGQAENLVESTTAANAKVAAANAKAATKAAQPTSSDYALSMTKELQGVSGKDSFVAPQDYAKAYYNWIAAGQSASTFNSLFGKFKDPNNGYYNYAINTYKGK